MYIITASLDSRLNVKSGLNPLVTFSVKCKIVPRLAIIRVCLYGRKRPNMLLPSKEFQPHQTHSYSLDANGTVSCGVGRYLGESR